MNTRSSLSPQLSSTVTPAQTGLLQRKCAECENKDKLLQRRAANSSGVTGVPAIVHEVLNSSGQPLDPATRSFMEPRFGHDFSQVRVHTDAKAAASAQSVNALAYTVGQNVVFGAGQYSPRSTEGRKLIAHELTHTLQQRQTVSPVPQRMQVGAADSPYEQEATRIADTVLSGQHPGRTTVNPSPLTIQRTCGPAAIGSVGGCVGRGGDITDFGFSSDHLYLFERNCDEFRPGEKVRLREFARSIAPDETVKIDGFASEEGPIDFNENLSCARAHKAADVLSAAGVASRIELFKHGATPGSQEHRRSVVITVQARPQQQQQDSRSNRTDSVSGSAGSISWIHPSSPAGSGALGVPDSEPAATITQSFITGNSGFRFSNYLNASITTRDSINIESSNFQSNSGLYTSPSQFGIASQRYPTRQNKENITRNGIQGVQFRQLVGARTISPAVAGGRVGAGVGVAGGAYVGAKAGGALGTFVTPGLGTAIGGVGGAIVGGVAGFFAGTATANSIPAISFPPIWTEVQLTLLANGTRECQLVRHSLFPSNSFYCDLTRTISPYVALGPEQTDWQSSGWGSGNPWGATRPTFTAE